MLLDLNLYDYKPLCFIVYVLYVLTYRKALYFLFLLYNPLIRLSIIHIVKQFMQYIYIYNIALGGKILMLILNMIKKEYE